MMELRFLREADTTTKPDVLQCRTNPTWRYLGYGVSQDQYEENWSEWMDVPVIIKGK